MSLELTSNTGLLGLLIVLTLLTMKKVSHLCRDVAKLKGRMI